LTLDLARGRVLDAGVADCLPARGLSAGSCLTSLCNGATVMGRAGECLGLRLPDDLAGVANCDPLTGNGNSVRTGAGAGLGLRDLTLLSVWAGDGLRLRGALTGWGAGTYWVVRVGRTPKKSISFLNTNSITAFISDETRCSKAERAVLRITYLR